MSNLEKYLPKPVADLVAPCSVNLTEPMAERHRIYALLLMAGVREYWCGNKYGREASYPLNPSKDDGFDGKYFDSDYVGHNIACIAVDADGDVIDFDFNHNELFNSSVEHAESRLVKRVFSLAQIHDTWNTGAPQNRAENYGTILRSVSVYTSLESCSQCSGIMALGQVKEVAFIQMDPGMYCIGNILRRLTEGTDLQAPLPVAASAFQLPYFEELNDRYRKFAEQQQSESGDPFAVLLTGKKKYTSSITSFLCTKMAFEVFFSASKAFVDFKVRFPDFKPLAADGQVLATSLSNEQALAEAKNFLQYMKEKGRRGTPHR